MDVIGTTLIDSVALAILKLYATAGEADREIILKLLLEVENLLDSS